MMAMKPLHAMFDPVWRSIELPSWLRCILDTDVFGRLRHLKQMGMSYLVFSGATHTRAAHSIGVAWLAMRLMRALGTKVPDLAALPPWIENSVVVAALCHDLGHGPMSHAFESFMQDFDPAWHHEAMSLCMLEYLVASQPYTAKVLAEQHVHMGLVKALVAGKPALLQEEDEVAALAVPDWVWQVVSDDIAGLDVDRLDYLPRDAQSCGLPCNVPVDSVIAAATVVRLPGGATRIAWPDTMSGHLQKVFVSRFDLHLQVYTHGTTRVAERMAMEALRQLQAHGWRPFEDRPDATLLDAVKDPALFVRLGDWVIDQGVLGTLPGFVLRSQAHTLFSRIRRRQWWTTVGEVLLNGGAPVTPGVVVDVLHREFLLDRSVFEVDVSDINCGRGALNPMEAVHFVQGHGGKSFSLGLALSTHQLKLVRVFAKEEKDVAGVTEAFAKFHAWLTTMKYM